MYTLGTSEGTQSNRVKKYLEVKYMDLDYEAKPDGDGFVMFRFPTLSEEEFRNMVFLLKRLDGVTLMGVDSQLTEKSIMKLTNLLNEFQGIDSKEEERPQLFPPGGNGFVDLVQALEKTLNSWKQRYASGYYTDEKNRADEYSLDLQELLELYKEKAPKSAKNDMGNYDSKTLEESKLRKLIRKTIRQ
jgi:hypothetical protein